MKSMDISILIKAKNTVKMLKTVTLSKYLRELLPYMKSNLINMNQSGKEIKKALPAPVAYSQAQLTKNLMQLYLRQDRKKIDQRIHKNLFSSPTRKTSLDFMSSKVA